MLQVKDITKRYPGDENYFAGVRGISFELEPGKVLAVIGESGSGKTTLLKLIYGLVTPDSGEVILDGEPVPGPEMKLIPGHDEMKMVPQDLSFPNPLGTVQDTLSAMISSTDPDKKEQRTDLLLELMRIKPVAGKRLSELSGGEKQRVAIARALMINPRILLLDEPFNQVDTSFREQLQQDIRDVVRLNNLSVILVSHDPAEVLSLADELMVLREGRMVQQDTPRDLYMHPGEFYTARLLVNGSTLTAGEAAVCGIHTQKKTVVIYPEHTHVRRSWTKKGFTVKAILFKGFYEELLVEKNGVDIRLLHKKPGTYQPGDKVHLSFGRYLEF